jgi:DnaJ-class molecular chaperone
MQKTPPLDYYSLLGLAPNASFEEIKKAYRRLSLKLHPDRNQGSLEATAQFQELKQAYEVLSNENARQQYDTERAGKGNETDIAAILNMFAQNIFAGQGSVPNTFGSNTFGSNTFGSNSFAQNSFGSAAAPFIFSMEQMKTSLAKPTPIILTETITLHQAYMGGSIPLEITRWILENEIKREESETVYLPLPKGVDHNELLILREKGNILRENNKGDVKVFIKIKNETEFVRTGLDLSLCKRISLKEALCGFSFDMTYVDNRCFKINNATGNIITSGYKKVLTGMGMKRDEHVGNLIITFEVVYPTQLTEAQVAALKNIL